MKPALLSRLADTFIIDALFYDVYTQLSELHLKNIGINVTWSDVDIIGDSANQDKWDGTRNYFGMRLYRLPIGMLDE